MVNKAAPHQANMAAIRSAISGILETEHPMTVRQVFYQLVVRGAIEETERAYKTVVIRLRTTMRMAGDIPFACIVDESRRTRQTRTFDNVADALSRTPTSKYGRKRKRCRDSFGRSRPNTMCRSSSAKGRRRSPSYSRASKTFIAPPKPARSPGSISLAITTRAVV